VITVDGRLAIKIINGRNGAFRVGTLQTEIGEFSTLIDKQWLESMRGKNSD